VSTNHLPELAKKAGDNEAWLETVLSWPVALYVLIVVGAQILLNLGFWLWRKRIAQRRAKAGLPDDIIMDHAERLSRVRLEAGLQAGLLLMTIFAVPLLITWCIGIDAQQVRGLLAAFVAMLVWLVWQGTDVAKAFLGGLAFRTLAAFKRPIQVGDRVTLKGQSGKVVTIGTFFVTLETLDGDRVNIPTHQLWSEVLVSANGGERSSLCVMRFYLSPDVKETQRQRAEDIIWDSMQASPFCEVAKPMQIYLSQTPTSICLTAKVYVTSTYDEPLFTSDVTRAFLDTMAEECIPLASDA
jgi:small-conductance mechanosensitive channel